MGSVQEAVLEFDEEVRAPWRPRLVPDSGDAAAARPPLAHLSRRNPSRVGVCRPPRPTSRPDAPVRQAAARPGGRAAPIGSAPVDRPPHRRPGPASRTMPGPGTPARLRLTRRARRLVLVLALATAVAAGSWLGPLFGGGGGHLRLVGESSVVVQSGDTLWSIASSLDRGGDVRTLVDEIQELNGLRDADLMPGQILLLP
jgi:nucleoid-associated protein YgaU